MTPGQLFLQDQKRFSPFSQKNKWEWREETETQTWTTGKGADRVVKHVSPCLLWWPSVLVFFIFSVYFILSLSFSLVSTLTLTHTCPKFMVKAGFTAHQCAVVYLAVWPRRSSSWRLDAATFDWLGLINPNTSLFFCPFHLLVPTTFIISIPMSQKCPFSQIKQQTSNSHRFWSR